jgi:hypothetical protein
MTPRGEVANDGTAACVVECKRDNLSDAVSELEAKSHPDAPVCNLCGQSPCDWESYGEKILEECNNLKEQGFENKAVRFCSTRFSSGTTSSLGVFILLYYYFSVIASCQGGREFLES